MQKNTFTDIVVIFNPNSTGSGKELAQELKRSLPKYKVRLVSTEYAGHAEVLAYECAKATPKPLVISASGDGGYHEVVNGLMRAQNEGATPVAGLLPAGNANDHYHDVHDTDLAKAIAAGSIQHIDLLKLTANIDGKTVVRYGHSYIGFGLTPHVGKELNKVDLNWFVQNWVVLKGLFTARPIKILVAGKRRTYESLIFSNVSKMSKVLSLSKDAANDDGKFEVTIFKRRNKLKLLRMLIKASTIGLKGSQQTDSYSFQTIKKTLVQVDGEVSSVDANSKVAIDIEHQVLSCVV